MSMFLILEDEPLIALDLQLAFEDLGHRAVTAADCAEAMHHIDREMLVGAVLDVSLGGGQTCEATANALTERKIPFVLHTGDLDRAGEFLRGLGAKILTKPISSEKVVGEIVALVH